MPPKAAANTCTVRWTTIASAATDKTNVRPTAPLDDDAVMWRSIMSPVYRDWQNVKERYAITLIISGSVAGSDRIIIIHNHIMCISRIPNPFNNK